MNRKVLTVFLVGLAVLGLFFMVACSTQAPQEDQPVPPPPGKGTAPPPGKVEPGTPPPPVKGEPGTPPVKGAPPEKGEPGAKVPEGTKPPGKPPVMPGEAETAPPLRAVPTESKVPGKPISGKVKIGLLLIHEDPAGVHTTLKEMQKNGKVEIVYEKFSNDPKQYVKQAKKVMAKGVHGLILTPGDGLYAEKVVELADKKGTPVFMLESIVMCGDVVSQIAIDYDKIGEKSAKFMGKELGKKGKVLVLSTKTSLDLENMGKAFKKEAEKSGMKVEIETVMSDKLKADKGIAQALSKHKNVQGVFAVDTDIALKAAKKMSAKKMNAALIGYGFNPDVEKAIMKYKFYKGNTMPDRSTMGAKTVEMVMKYLKEGKKVPRRISPDVVVLDAKTIKKGAKIPEPPKGAKPVMPSDKSKKAPPEKEAKPPKK
ncbi:MAG: substrate-binding domain-containing protein [Candidatus Eremiobacteraeota bacterium]|nr:substrate-binding domain-containing protein [Candidatus Eremiobacteraeota bacterium]